MITDTSAVVAIVRLEPLEFELTTKIMSSPPVLMAAPNFLEAHMVLRKYLGNDTESLLREKLRELGVQVVPFTPEQTEEATRAFDRFGKGRHPAGLNFGDCIAYALARTTGEPLLFVGDDFSKTDVLVA